MMRSTHNRAGAPELTHQRIAAALADHRAKGVLQPTILHFERCQHEIFLALEMLVEGPVLLMPTDIRQHLAPDRHCENPSR